MTTTDRNKAQFQKLITDVINTGRLDLADQYLTVDRPDYQEFGMPAELTKGYAGFQRTVGMFREAFPDLKFTSEWMIAEGDKVLSYNRIEGTHKNPFMGIPPTNKRFVAYAADVCSFGADGKITAHWGVFDMFGAMIQLGVIPMPK